MTAANDISFTVLNTFIAVFETREFTAAADELAVSQSTVSKRIASLEHVCGTALFIRKSKSELQPTQAGRTMYAQAAQLVSSWSRSIHSLRANEYSQTPFTLLLSHTASSTLLPTIIRGIRSRVSTTNFSIQTMNSEHIINSILNKGAQMGIIEKPVTTDLVNLQVLCQDQLVVAGNASSHLESDASTLRDEIWLVREAGSGVRYFTDLFFQSSSVTPSHVIELDSNEKIRTALAAGVGSTLMSRSSVPAGVPTVTLGAPFIRNFYAVTPKTGLNPVQDDIASHICALLEQ